ncbi:DUF4350 domain-containing protein [Qipengyuania marisflavi]|uniref:ABC transporter n=1 Tax=Qipengyuania marisflavi TaxID=2486356 RepID=A0A5S3PYC2_9SPHN|nr:DUF4350 domain-containing protein [Qipengyuania marisflavi]TMM48796.1 ABC transporter [Qipengyuania marisflavi]
MRSKHALLLAALASSALTGCNDAQPQADNSAGPELGLFTTLPIYWGEGEDITALLDPAGEPDWVRSALEERYRLQPLDTLSPDTLKPLALIFLAQPRVLAPAENLALDEWVRSGGRALIMADPMLTRHSEYALGDKRRPQDVAVLSPILARWGLELRFNEDQQGGERNANSDGYAIPVDLAGQFVLKSTDAPADCTVSEDGILARCRIGEGQVTLLADAALLDWEGPGAPPPQRRGALDSLLAESLVN